jgi:hypothetical protein
MKNDYLEKLLYTFIYKLIAKMEEMKQSKKTVVIRTP